jgi:hypothetical protein
VGVDNAEGEALILLDELEGAVEVRGLGCQEAQLAPLHRAQECDLRSGALVLLQVAADLYDNRRRDEQGAARWRASTPTSG